MGQAILLSSKFGSLQSHSQLHQGGWMPLSAKCMAQKHTVFPPTSSLEAQLSSQSSNGKKTDPAKDRTKNCAVEAAEATSAPSYALCNACRQEAPEVSS